MDTERKISVANDSGSYEGFSDNIFDDDGFFSDVPLNGSMTKSLIALNEYVKVNLIHGDLSDAAVDREFETILRESDQGFERDKIKNEVSKDKDSIIAHTIDRNGSNNSKYFINYQENKVNLENQLTASPENTLLEGIPNDENNNFNANHESKEHASSEGNMLSDSFPYPDTPISSIAAEKRDADSKNIEDNTEINAATLNTENDISSRDDKLNRDVSKSLGNLERIEENVLKCSEKNSSAENVGARARYKLPQTNPASRHSYHDFTDWGNRTEQYPDVYAPLPYKSPRRYVESDVNIHYRCPVRRDPLPHVPERELARRQAEHMRRLYQEERRRKYLQDVNPLHIEAFDQSIKELQDMQSRRHTDNFTPAQKSVVPLNRYDEPDASASAGGRRAAARALYAFAGQSARELSFRKGDVIGVRRQVDANWYEGELNGKVGLFPYNYVEILKGESPASSKPAPATEGRARAKFDFTAQTNLELPLKKGEVVVLTRRIDQNWWEGRHGSKTGIFPDSYVQVLAEPSLNKPEPLTPLANKPLASPASHGLLSGGAKHSMGSHSYQPQLNSAALSNGPQPNQPLAGQYAANYHAKPAQATLTPSERGYGPPSAPGVDLNNREPLYIDTNAEAVPYRAMYKYRPQNPDELELSEGDTVYVLEQCDDGWYVGSSQRSGKFGTFPGNYVERI